ncbi:MAG: methyltransferase domain-containing protein [Planctomycetes bacterium]|nr:methyltransferase domain-containing protein [Planctomycetota bacterium]
MVNAGALREAVRRKYACVAKDPADRFPYTIGRAGALKLGYRRAWIDGVDPAVVERFVGVGNPFSIPKPRPGERVLDLGCGAGFDAFVASRLVGRAGSVVGIDLTAAMLAVPRRALAKWPFQNLEFRRGDIEKLPFADASFDAAFSNGVLNLVPDKLRAFREIRRVLRPGGILAAADLLVVSTIPRKTLASMDAWST